MTEEQWKEERQSLLDSIGYIDIDEEGESVCIDGHCTVDELLRITALMEVRKDGSPSLC